MPGPLSIRAHADSVDLAVIEALSPNLRQVQGSAAIDARINGSWDQPRLDGFVAVRNGSLRVPGLGVSYGPIDGRIALSGDSVIADSLRIRGGIGDLVVTGSVRLAQLTRPILALSLSAREFPLINVPDYLTIQARGDVQLTGPIEHPVLTGSALATNSVIYFADLISKDIVNLEDPLTADLVDTTALRAQHLGSQFQSRFLDSLTIRDLRFRVGQDVWLRSNEANIQLEGQVTVNKEPRRSRAGEYRVSGQLTTPRGTYTLKLGPVFRTFTVDQGTVQYFNTPDLNAGLDITARHLVRTVLNGGEDYPVIARITGTLLVPKLTLASAPDRPPLAERDLITLLVTGTTTNSLLGPDRPGVNAGAAAAAVATILSSELQRTLISSPGSKLDLVEIRPGVAQSGLFATGGTVTTLAVGRQLSRKLFVTLNLGGCLGIGGGQFQLATRYLGATLEFRIRRQLTLQAAAEPVQSCLTQTANALAIQQRYQFAADLKWDREY
jgi:translocation and assembly module TamB